MIENAYCVKSNQIGLLLWTITDSRDRTMVKYLEHSGMSPTMENWKKFSELGYLIVPVVVKERNR